MGLPRPASTRLCSLFAQPEPGNDLFVPGCILFAEISQVPPTLAYHLEQTASGVIIVLVSLEVLDELVDAIGQKGDLYLW